jgi:hypothetical protein
MTKDYQEIAEDIKSIMDSHVEFYYTNPSDDLMRYLTTTLATYGNVRERQGVEKVESEIERMKSQLDPHDSRGDRVWVEIQSTLSGLISYITKVKNELK